MPNYRELLYENNMIRFYQVHIDGIEVTQSIQHYHSSEHLTSQVRKDNSIPMIAFKPAYVRVYVRSGLLQSDVPGITGRLNILRRSKNFTYDHITTLLPKPPGSVTASQNPTHDEERSNLRRSLNFFIPPRSINMFNRVVTDIMCGSLRLRAIITTADGRTDTMEVDVNATLEQTLRLRGILVSYSGPASNAMNAPPQNFPAPTLADLQTNAALTLSMFPVQSKGVYSTAGSIPLTQHLQDTVVTTGFCSSNWNNLLTLLQTQRVADGNRTDWLYYGLLPTGTPVGNGPNTNTGCGQNGLGSGAVGFVLAMAHELGHASGLDHAPCAVGASADPNYPAYMKYDAPNTPQASIGEYGIDTSSGTIFSPAIIKDLMSYCPNSNWISLYHYGKLFNNSHLSSKSVYIDEYRYDEDLYYLPKQWGKQALNMENVISVIGVMHNETQIEVKSVMRLDTNPNIQNGQPTEQIVELISSGGNTIARTQLYALKQYGNCGCGCGNEIGKQKYPYVFQAFLSATETGDELAIRSGEKILWSLHKPNSEPVVTDFRVHIREKQLLLAWTVQAHCEKGLEIWVQWTKSESEIWQALSSNLSLSNSEAAFDLSLLPSCLIELRLLVSNGFHTTISDRISVEVPERPAEVSILCPRDGQKILAGSMIHLWGAAQSCNQEEIEDENVSWFLNGREIEMGFDTFFVAPEAGEHKLELIVSTKQGRSGKTIIFRTINEDNIKSQLE